ncbi:hypothetical protein [Nocardioides sp. HB32]
MESMSVGAAAPAIFEPLRPSVIRAVDRVVPGHGYPRLAPTDIDWDMEGLLRRIFRGRHLSRWSTAQLELRDLPSADQLIVKEVRANRMAGWIERQFSEVRTQLIIRHPLAVVASMHRGAWGALDWDDVVPPAAAALGVHPHEIAPRNSAQSRWLMALWLADNTTAVREVSSRTLANVIHYEDLVADPATQVERLAGVLDHFDAGQALMSLDRPSRHASPDYGRERELPFTAAERDDLAAMLRDFEVDYYELTEPNPTYRLGSLR